MKIVSIVGARPQFIKAAALSRVLRAEHDEILVHTGQHYDYEMSKVFFEGLGIPAPDYDLEIGSASHAEQTAGMLAALEPILLDEKPDLVLVYGDTNSTLAGALAAPKLHIPLAHVEAGLRSFNRCMPEEINRVITDRASTLLFCPTPAAVANLRQEGVQHGVHLVGDVMLDVAMDSARLAEKTSTVLQRLGLRRQGFLLATVHRAGNTDDAGNLREIVTAFAGLDEPVVWPMHPRTRKRLEATGLGELLARAQNVILTEPLDHLDFVMLEKNARKILTDSGGIQKEACFHQVPCITLREETEWVETVKAGWNVLVGANREKIVREVARPFATPDSVCEGVELWDGKASGRIAACVRAFFDQIAQGAHG